MVPQAPFGDLTAANAAARARRAEVKGAVHSEICAVPAERLATEAGAARPAAVAAGRGPASYISRRRNAAPGCGRCGLRGLRWSSIPRPRSSDTQPDLPRRRHPPTVEWSPVRPPGGSSKRNSASRRRGSYLGDRGWRPLPRPGPPDAERRLPGHSHLPTVGSRTRLDQPHPPRRQPVPARPRRRDLGH
jgi:hypothetical protein